MGERSIQEKYQAWRKCPGMNEELHNQLKAMSPDELNDSFYRSLAFGTGGLRGVLGAGENRMNLYTVSKATRGLGRYLLETCEKPSCAVSCDSRIHSRDFAELTAATLAEMGIRVYLYRTLMPTPMLSYAVRHLHTSAGVMVTASHNPAKFNGYKVYGADGCQITIEAADRIYSFISAEQTLQPSLPSFQKYLDNGMISYIDDETIESYYQMINGLRIAPHRRAPAHRLQPAQRHGQCAGARNAEAHGQYRRGCRRGAGNARRPFPDLPVPEPRNPRGDEAGD